jgi:Secretion system C-terminal sorting domain
MRYLISTFLVLLIFNTNAQDTTNIYPPNKKLYTAQMHLHGYSNHNANGKPGSLQWHSKFADSTNTDIIWWTEHRDIYKQNVAYKFKFTNGIYDSINNEIIGLTGDVSNPIRWAGDKNGGQVSVSLSTDTLNIKFTDIDSSETLIYASFTPKGTKGTLKSYKEFLRPLISQPIVTFELTKNGVLDSTHNKLTAEIYLSYHFYNQAIQQKLIYNFIDAPIPFSYQLLDSSNLIINYPVENGNNFIELDIATDAMMLQEGKDNAMQDFKITLMTKNNDSLTTKFSNIRTRCNQPENYANHQKIFEYINEYKSQYNIQELVGTEILSEGDKFTHLNGFLPDTSEQSVMYVDSTGLNLADVFVDGVHERGGIVSLNHPFGTSFTVDYETQEYRTDTMAEYLLNNDAFNCDVLEVGYLKRGEVDIYNHLRLWDILTANQLYLYGSGVSDMHGGDWLTNNFNWVNYIWAKDSSANNLIETLKEGRFYFGDARLYKDKFYFCVGDACMGDRTPANYLEAPLIINAENVPENAVFKLTQGLIQPGILVSYIYKDSIIDWQNPPCLTLSEPNFIRLGMYINDEPIFFSNPIVFYDTTDNPNTSLCIVDNIAERYIDLANYKLYPSPTNKDINVTIDLPENRKIKISIIDFTGKYIKYLGKFNFKKGTNTKLFSNLKLSNGNYFLLLENENINKSLPFTIVN